MSTLKKLNNSIQCYTPAMWWGETWREGFFTGNGIMGANVFGGAIDEKVLINHSDLLWQGRISVVPDVSLKIKDVKKLVEEGDYESASTILSRALISKNFRPQPSSPLPLGLLKIHTNGEKAVKDYTRCLNMSNGEISVSYVDGNTKINRNLFVSRANNTLVYEFTKSGSKQLDVMFSFDIMDAINARTPHSSSVMPEGVKISYDKYFMFLSARNDNGTEYGAVAKVNYYGGNMETNENGIHIYGANSIILYLRVFVESSREKELSRLKTELAALKEPYDKLLKAHSVIHNKLFSSANLTFDNQNDGFIEELIADCHKGDVSPLILEKMWKYGRYLMISGASEHGRLFTPYGLWNGEYKAYKSIMTYSGPIESTYRHTIRGNVLYAVESFFDYIESQMGDFVDNAQRLFDCKGIFIPTITSTNTGRLGSVDPNAIHFTGCAGWIASLYNEYSLVTGNTKFYKTRALPFMKQVVTFYEDFFKLGDNGKYLSIPSVLPMVSEPSASCVDLPFVAKNASIDFAIARELLTNLIAGALETGLYKDEIDKWKEMLGKLPAPCVTNDGLVAEYIDVNRLQKSISAENSMFYELRNVNVNDASNDELIKAFTNTAKKKLSEALSKECSYNLSNLALTFAKLGQKSLAIECIDNVIRGCALNNLCLVEKDWRGMGMCGSGVWVPIQLQANMALVNAIQEMILSSKVGEISILPCVPNDWQSFSVNGFLAVGGVEVDINLNGKNSTLTVDLKAKKGVNFNLVLPEGTKKLLKSSTKLPFDAEKRQICGIELNAGKSCSFTFKYVR